MTKGDGAEMVPFDKERLLPTVMESGALALLPLLPSKGTRRHGDRRLQTREKLRACDLASVSTLRCHDFIGI